MKRWMKRWIFKWASRIIRVCANAVARLGGWKYAHIVFSDEKDWQP